MPFLRPGSVHSLAALALVLLATLAVACTTGAPAPKPKGEPPALFPTPAGVSTVQPRPGGTLNVAVPTLPAVLNPRRADCDETCRFLQPALYETLLGVGSDGYLVGRIVTNWELPDQHTIRLRLRPNVRFTDGSPVTAAVVAENLRHLGRLPAPTGGPTTAGVWNQQVAAIELADAQNLIVRLRQPFAPAISIFAQPWTAIVPQGDLLAENPAGSGPFRLVSHSGALRLERKTDYWRTPAAWVDAVVVTPASTAPREASFAAGSSDLAASLPFGSLPQGARRLPAPGLNVASLAFNTRRAPFGDVRVRTALSQIIDRARTVRDLGIPAQPTGLPIGPAQWQFSPALQGQVTDVTGGRALLQHAGAQGLRLTVIAEDGPNVARLTQLIGRDWTAEGITAQFDILDSVAYRQRLQAGSFDAALILDAQPQHDAWWSLADAYLGASAARPSGWSNPAFEQAVSQAVAARIHEEAEPFWRDAIGILVAETPHAYLFSPASLTWLGVGPRVRDAIWAGPLLRWDTLWLNQ